MEKYIENPSFDAYALSQEELGEEYLLTNLRTKDGINRKEYEMRFAESFDDRFGSFISDLDPSWYIDTAEGFSLTEEGFLVLDSIILKLAMAI